MRISSDTLQLVSYINIFVVGIIAALVIQRVFKKFFPHEHKDDTKKSLLEDVDKKGDEQAIEHIDSKAEAAVDRMLSTEPLEDEKKPNEEDDPHETKLPETDNEVEVAESAKTFEDEPAEPSKSEESPKPAAHIEHGRLEPPTHDDRPNPPVEKNEETPAPAEFEKPREAPAIPTTAPAAAKVTKPSRSIALALSGHLAPEIKQHLIAESHEHFTASLEKTTHQLEHDLQTVTDKLATHLDKLGSTVINTEMERYSKQLERLRHQAETAISGAQAGIDKHQASLQAELEAQRKKLEAHMNEEIAAEKKRLAEQLAAEQQKVIAQIDTKLGDAMASFLMETLQHNVDLGAQNNYLLAMLEEHKDDFKREVGLNDDARA